eukprot:856115_1
MWSSKRGRWYFLPRSVNTEEAHARAAKLMISCNEYFSKCKVQTVLGMYRRDRGFSSFKFVPGSNDAKVVALKTVEKTVEDDSTDPATTTLTFKTYFTMFE